MGGVIKIHKIRLLLKCIHLVVALGKEVDCSDAVFPLRVDRFTIERCRLKFSILGKHKFNPLTHTLTTSECHLRKQFC